VKVTIRDIAKIAGVSHSTVSRSLNDHPSISPGRREQIKKIARELGFEYNANAVRLRGGKIGTVGIIATKNISTTFFLDSLIRKITHEEQNSFLDYIVSFPQSGIQGTNNIRRLVSAGKVDGFILMHPEITYADYEFLTSQSIPFVLLHFKPSNFTYEHLNYFLTDHEHGAFLATNHLIQLGRRKLLSISEGGGEVQFMERSAGFRRALEENGIPFEKHMLIEGECSFEFGRQVVFQRRGVIHKYDAIFAQADVIALGIISALKELNIRVPEDISVVGYDDIQIGEYVTPRLTTVHQPLEDMDHQACLRINDLINDQSADEPVQRIFNPGLVIRDSCIAAVGVDV
jgi:LacI family transcriptional regulator